MKLNIKTFGFETEKLVLLHGLFGHQRNLFAVARSISDRFEVIVPDQRNHGDSPHTNTHSIEELTSDLFALADELGIDRFSLLGHSMGGMAAMNAALSQPRRIKTLIIEDIGPLPQKTITDEIVRILSSLDLSHQESKSTIEGELLHEIKDRTVVKFFMTNIRQDPKAGFLWKFNLPVLTEFVRQFADYRLKPGRKYNGPTLFIAGSRSQHDVKSQQTDIRHFFPRSQVAVIKGAGHWVHFNKKEEMTTLVRAFLNRNLST